MTNQKTMEYPNSLAFALIAVLSACSLMCAGGDKTGGGGAGPVDIVTGKGKTFRNTRVIRVEPDALLIEHEGGLARLPFFDLSAEIQKKYDFDPMEALRYSEMTARREKSRQEGLAAESELQRIARDRAKRVEESGDVREQGSASKREASSPPPVRRSIEKDSIELAVLDGRFGGIKMGMQEAAVREQLKSAGFRFLSEMPYSESGKLIAIEREYSPGGINFRFTEDGRLFQIYALRTKVPIEGGLELGTSTVRQYEDVLGCKLKEYEAPNGDQAFTVTKGRIKVSFHREADDPDVIFSIMMTDNRN